MWSRATVTLTKNTFIKGRLKIADSQARSFSDSAKKARETPLYRLHKRYNGKLVDFAGFLLPVQYPDLSISASHLFTRSSASIFDVSHMLQTNVYGKDCVPWFESLCPVDLRGSPPGTSSLTVFLNESGGIIDDLIVTKVGETHLYVVSNAARAAVDERLMLESAELYRRRGKDVTIEFWDASERALIALQGPRAAASLQPLTDVPLGEVPFMTSRAGSAAGVRCRITRCGYTGEDGFEISLPADAAAGVAEALLRSPRVRLAGLGARDSLRLEAGLCLYGRDIDESTSPVEASLAWLVARRRRAERGFPGADVVVRQIQGGVARRRVGLRLAAGPSAREGAALSGEAGAAAGSVTSGCPSPSLGGAVAMGYVARGFAAPGTRLLVDVRGGAVPCVVTQMPFVPSKYFARK